MKKKILAILAAATILVGSAVGFAASQDNYNGGGCGCYHGGCWR